MNAGCKQKVSPGQLLGLSGSIFSDKAVKITDPPKEEEGKPDSNPIGMTTGAIVGIAVGAALLFLGGAALFIVYHQKQKKMYRLDLQSDYDPRGGNSRNITPSPFKGGGGNGGGSGFGIGIGIGHHHIDSKPPPMMSTINSDYELRAQKAYGGNIGSNAEYYDKLEEQMRSRQPNYSLDPNHPASGPQGALPTHPAYIPRAMSRASVRSASPQPPAPIKSNKPDSYALEMYLAAADEAAALKIPPPPPKAPSSSSRSQTPELTAATAMRQQPVQPLHTKPSPALSLQAMRTPPPPPSRKPPPKVPSLVLPSVPRIRVPKKYAPPQINVQEATPTEGPSDIGADDNISRPLARDDTLRFADRAFGNRTPSPDMRSEAPLIPHYAAKSDAVPHVVVDRRRHLQYEEVELHTGKSTMYG